MSPDTAHWLVYCDGSAVPNPGRMGLGAVLVGPDGVTQHHISEATTFTGCNNEAELRALLAALQWLARRVAATSTAVRVISDSSVLVAQLGAHAAPPIARLAPLFDEARGALQQFAHIDLQWVPRHRNGAADTLARAALGLAPKVATPQGQKVKRPKRR
ncbi:MAG: reverse transcriptase-like protein [Acidovorax sp.]|uniref:reverse transcriptase-like protein n=1 Tax=Acidovorax sp. TaxID=1872122 RepID=UPI00391D5196